MKRTELKALVMMVVATVYALAASAQIPQGYYDALKGKKGAELKTAVHNIIKEATVVTGDAQHGVYVVKQGKNIFKVMR